MILAKKVRLKPTPEQEEFLWKSAGVARWVYNWTLTRCEENYKNGEKLLSDRTLRKEITQIKKLDDFKWLGEVSNDVAKQAVKDACGAYKKFFKGLSKRPRFKSRKRSRPAFYNDIGKLKVKGLSVSISKTGWIKTSEPIPENEKYTNPRITHDGKYWYISVSIEKQWSRKELSSETIGIDLGIKELATCSDGRTFKNINKTNRISKIEKRIRRLQRKASRKYELNKDGNSYKKTNNISKINKQMKILYRRLTNIRLNHIHQATNAIAKTKPGMVVMEDLNVKGMMKNRYLSKAIQKQKLYEFIRQMKYKCEKYGIEFVQVDRFYPSSKTCSSCGEIKKNLKLSHRKYECDCGLSIDRDLNAALNLAKMGRLKAIN